MSKTRHIGEDKKEINVRRLAQLSTLSSRLRAMCCTKDIYRNLPFFRPHIFRDKNVHVNLNS